jgi:uncharacterized protein with NRDE domain
MCLVLLACATVPGYPLVLAANRDEDHERPAQALAWWADAPAIVGGRDDLAGGTWLAVRRDGWFGLVVNAPELAGPAAAPSRGRLVTQLLQTSRPWMALTDIAAVAPAYAGFHLLAGHGGQVFYLTNTDTHGPRSLASGIHTVSNAGLDTDDPRSRRARSNLPEAAWLDPTALLAQLADRRAVGPGGGDDRPVFLAGERFGTRSTTLVWAHAGGRIDLYERRFGPNGRVSGDTRLSWNHEPGVEDAP